MALIACELGNVTDSLGDLLPVIRSFPLFGSWHRMDWSVLRPFMTLSAAELGKSLGARVCAESVC